MRAVPTGALLLCMTAHAVRAEVWAEARTGDAGTVAASAPAAKADCIQAPDAAQGAGMVLLGGMTLLLLTGHGSLFSGEEPDTTKGLQPGR